MEIEVQSRDPDRFANPERKDAISQNATPPQSLQCISLLRGSFWFRLISVCFSLLCKVNGNSEPLEAQRVSDFLIKDASSTPQ